MNSKYGVNKMHICTLDEVGNGYIKPNLNEYPETRLCVVDSDKGIVVDVLHQLQYDYIETINRLYLINKLRSKIKDNKRIAIFPYKLICMSREESYKVEDIINKLKNGYKFCDGNDVYNNEEYLNELKKEKRIRETNNGIKKLIKRKK